MHNLFQRGKYSNKRKSRGKENRVHTHAQSLKKLKGKEGRNNAQGEKGKKPSSSSNVSSSDSSKDSESETSATNKRFKVIVKGEEFRWNLPASMAKYANHHFNAYTPDKGTEKKVLTEHPVPSNLQQVKPLDDFIRSLLPSQTVTT